MHELGIAQRAHVEALEQAELLQRGRALPPRPCLADREPAVVDGRGRLEGRTPAREVVARQQASLLAGEAIDLFRDEPLVVDLPRAFDLPLARPAARLVEQPHPRGRQLLVAERRARPRRREVERSRARPLAQQGLDALDHHRDPADDRIAVLRVADRELEHVLQPPRPELLEQEQPAADRAGHAGREQPSPRHELVPEPAVPLDRRRGRRDALGAEHERLAAVH